MFNFERLQVWHRAIAFSALVYELTRTLPASERLGLSSQIRRSSVSIASKIAEGAARSKPDYIKFLGYAAGSLNEVVTQAAIAQKTGLMDESSFQRIYNDAETVSRMLSGLRRSLRE
jgi:four helix bundle protein